jgi:hypothetical protein
MRALMIGAAVMGFSPWLIPSIALAAKMTPEQVRNACRSEMPQNRSGDKGNARRGGQPRNQEVLQECIKAKVGRNTG